MENGEKVGRERDRERESHGILSSPRLLKMYTEMITSATSIRWRLCNLFTHSDINFFGFNVFTSECNCTRISLRCNIEETNSSFAILIF